METPRISPKLLEVFVVVSPLTVVEELIIE